MSRAELYPVCAVDKKLTVDDLRVRADRRDHGVGAEWRYWSLSVVITCAATLHARGVRVESATDAAEALTPLAGPYARSLCRNFPLPGFTVRPLGAT
jgi:hypothetical protein